MSNKQLYSIQSKMHPKVLSCMDYNRNRPMELRYGRHKYSGLRLIDYRVEQQVRNIQFMYTIMTHPKHQTLMQSIIDYYLLSAGITTPILEYPTNST